MSSSVCKTSIPFLTLCVHDLSKGPPILPLCNLTAATLVVGVISQILKMNQDDQIIYIAGSFNDKIDDLGVKYGLIAHKNKYARVGYEVLAA